MAVPAPVFTLALASETHKLASNQAKSLIKSLERFTASDVEEMCQIVRRFKADAQ
jgi:isopropylmalate/homocitrate/citramalate synthase